MRLSRYLAAAFAVTIPLLLPRCASAQLVTRPKKPFAVYLNIPVDTFLSMFESSDDPDNPIEFNPWNAGDNIGFSARCDLAQTRSRTLPVLVSAFYDNFRVSDTFTTTYNQVNGVSNTYPGGDNLRAQGFGLQARVFVAGVGASGDSRSIRGLYLSAAEGYFHVTGSHDSVGLSLNPIFQLASETKLTPKFSLGFDDFAADVQLTYCPFNNLAIASFDGNQPVMLQVGMRF